MIYSSPEFLILFLLTLLLYGLARPYWLRFGILLTASLVFLAWAGLSDLLVFSCVVMASWLAVALAHRCPRAKPWLITAGIVLITLHLVFWKYTPWLVGQVQHLDPGFFSGRALVLPMPLGISFYTLQSIAYLVDYSSGEAAFVSLPTYALFKSFFAQLLAGPIVRAHELLPQLEKLERPAPSQISLGLTLFVLGFVKKVAVADRLAYFFDVTFLAPNQFGRITLLSALLGYAVQIWADFSGYTDMGRGAALMLGIRLPENFLSPYLAATPSEFWQRWHISLSSWIKDYLFTPLALSWARLSKKGVFLAGAATMLIAGLWHGAGWHFALFGLYHGLLLYLERRLHWPKLPEPLASLRRSLQTLLMFLLAAVGFLLFRIENLSLLAEYLRGLTLGGGSQVAGTGHAVWPLLALCFAIQAAGYYDFRTERWVFLDKSKAALSRLLPAESRPTLRTGGAIVFGVTLALFMVGALVLRPPQARAFIYFQF